MTTLPTDLTIFGFNTERLYQADGQRISVGFRTKDNSNDPDTLEVWFNDHSRGIWGKIDADLPYSGWCMPFCDDDITKHIREFVGDPDGDKLTIEYLKTLARRVMRAYDGGQYHMATEAGSLTSGWWLHNRM